MRVAVVCPYDLGLRGGVQQLAIELVDRVVEAGHEAWLVGPGTREGARSVGATVKVRANASLVPVAMGPGVRRRVREAVAGADVVHVHEPFMPRVSTSALGVERPLVATFHADAPAWAAGLYRVGRAPLGRWLGSAVVTAVSTVAARHLPAAWGPIEIIPNALDVARYASDQAAEPHRVTFLGRDDPRKGLDVILRAWPAVHAAVPNAELVVIGARRSEEVPGVRFVGRVDETEKRALLASGAIHVAPNLRGESFGIVVAEAMAAGSAVVASDLEAFTDVLAGTGIQVPVGDVTALAAAVITLLGDPPQAARLGRAARSRAADFDWSVVTDQYLGAYHRALG